MIGVCIPYTSSGEEQKNWDYILSNFKVDTIYVLNEFNKVMPNTNVMGQGTEILSYSELPQDHKIVLLAPIGGHYYKGNISLIDYVHSTTDVIYIAGSNSEFLDNTNFRGGKEPDELVYIPTDTIDEMFNWTAMVVTLYDRLVKNG